MKALLIVAHGSRLEKPNDDTARLVESVAARAGSRWDEVRIGFLQAGSPAAADVLEELAGRQADEIRIVPLFIASGRHVSEDIPALIAAVRERHPRVAVAATPHLGAWGGMAETILTMAGEPST